MFGLSKENHSRIILEFYKAGYITTIERDSLIACLYRTYNKKTNEELKITVKAEKRELAYYYKRSLSTTTIFLYVKRDFCVQYSTEKCRFTIRELI